jgi:pimeloyl-ACP methyl ester carboxylesterase
MSDRLDVAVEGGRLATDRLGAGADTSAPLVLAIHGITSTSRTWLATARALDNQAVLLAPDLRGRGRSIELPPVVGLDAHVRDMVAVLDAAGLERAVVAGHSLGAYIAARLAVRHPDRVARLVLIDGGLTIPASAGTEPAQFVQEFLGPTFARLEMAFPDIATYQAWWAQHPAVVGADVNRADLDAYAAYDLVGEPPQLRSGIRPQVVSDDGLDLFGDPERRRAIEVPDTNHYTIAWGAHGAAAVADAIAAAVS